VFAIVLGLSNGVMTGWDALILATYTSMQLVEYALWKNINSPPFVRLFSVVGFIILMAEPLASIMRLSGQPDKVVSRNVLLACYVAYVLVILIVILQTNLIVFNTTVAANGHLQWHFLPTTLWLLLPWMLLFFIPIWLNGQYIAFTFTLLVLIVSIYTWWGDRTWGSMWCWFAGFASLYYIAAAFYTSGTCSHKVDLKHSALSICV
jgi:hypothetical protein